MRSIPFAAAFLLLTACSGEDSQPEGEQPTGEAVEQLEAAAVEAAADAPWEGFSASGLAQVSGAERDFSVTVQTADGDVTVGVHVPGLSDLLAIEGRDVDLEVSQADLHEERAVFIHDDAGPLFIVDDGNNAMRVQELMGPSFASWGETVGTLVDDQYDWTYTKAVFQSDDGEVALAPGEAQTITVDGVSWRVVAIAAYQVTPHPDAALPCGGISDLLSYELMRVDTPAPAAQIVRPADEQMAYLGCL